MNWFGVVLTIFLTCLAATVLMLVLLPGWAKVLAIQPAVIVWIIWTDWPHKT